MRWASSIRRAVSGLSTALVLRRVFLSTALASVMRLRRNRRDMKRRHSLKGHLKPGEIYEGWTTIHHPNPKVSEPPCFGDDPAL